MYVKTNKDNQGQVIGVRLANDDVLKIDELASSDGRTRSNYIRKIILEHLNGVLA